MIHGKDFKLLGKLTNIEVIARGNSIRDLKNLRRRYGRGTWKKLKGIAEIELLDNGTICLAEIHWYEAHGIGRKELKVKEIIEP